MTIKSTLSVVALLAGVSFSGAAFAQTMVGTYEFTDEQLPIVQAYCDDIALNASTGETAGTPPAAEQDAEDAMEDDVDAMESGLPAHIDLETVSLEDCQAAGLVD